MMISFDEVVKAPNKRTFWTDAAKTTLDVEGLEAIDAGYLIEAEYFNSLTEEHQAEYADSLFTTS